MDLDRAQIRRTLERLRDDLLRQEEESAHERGSVELDQTSVGRLSRMDAMQVQAMALATQRRRKAEISKIESALERIDTEEFGYCRICGEPIAEARLTHDPAVTSCIGCAD